MPGNGRSRLAHSCQPNANRSCQFLAFSSKPSYAPEEQVKAGEVDEAEEVLDMVFPSSDESAEVVHPGKQSLHFPALPPVCRYESIAGSGGGRSDTADISPVVRATAPRYPAPRTRRSAPLAYRATVGRGCPHAAAVAAPAPPRPTVRQSVPSVLSRRFAVIPEQPQDRTKTPLRHL